MHTTGQLATAFAVSEITIKRWVTSFGEFFSQSAQPDRGKTRMFTDEDVEVLAEIAELRNLNRTEQEIYAALKRGDRGVPPTGREITVITNNQITQALAVATQEIEKLKLELEKVQERAIRAEGREDLLREMLKEKEAEIARLRDGRD